MLDLDQCLDYENTGIKPRRQRGFDILSLLEMSTTS